MQYRSLLYNILSEFVDNWKEIVKNDSDDDDNDDDDSDDSEKEAEEPVVTEESRLTTEEYIPPVVVGQIFVKTLTGKTIAMSGITTWTTIIDIKRFIEESEGIPTQIQRLTLNGKKVKDYHTVGYYNIKKESTLQLVLRNRGAACSAHSRAPAVCRGH
jgi:hypothetical protein